MSYSGLGVSSDAVFRSDFAIITSLKSVFKVIYHIIYIIILRLVRGVGSDLRIRGRSDQEIVGDSQQNEDGQDDAEDDDRLLESGTLLNRIHVHIPSGGTLCIEQTEAFVCIDVNSSRVSEKKQRSDAASIVNREAAFEAARQIRLRQLSGTILIDFINCRSEEEERGLLDILRSETSSDPVAVKVTDFTRLHICELTRKKTYRSLKEQINNTIR